MNSDEKSELLEPFGVFKQWMREQTQDEEKWKYGKKKPGRPESKLEAQIG